jgi:hypothetical protein
MKFVGMDLKDAIPILKEMGANVEVARRSGEYVISHEVVGRVRVNCRRQDCSRSLSVYLKKLHKYVTDTKIAPKWEPVDTKKLVLSSAVAAQNGDAMAPAPVPVMLSVQRKEPKAEPPAPEPAPLPPVERVRPPKPPKPQKPPKFVSVAAPAAPKPGGITSSWINEEAFLREAEEREQERELERLTAPPPPPELPPIVEYEYVAPEPTESVAENGQVMNDTDENAAADTEMEAETPTPEPAVTGNLSDQIKLYREMRQKIAENGLKRLEQLRSDREGIVEMLRDTDKEIDQLCQELSEAGVTIPVNLIPLPAQGHVVDAPRDVAPRIVTGTPVPVASTAAPIGSTVEDVSPELLQARKLAGQKAAETRRARAAARSLPPAVAPSAAAPASSDWRLPVDVRIVEYLKDHDDEWLYGRDILEGLGLDIVQPSTILGPLVEAGKIERRGVHRYTQYRYVRPEDSVARTGT